MLGAMPFSETRIVLNRQAIEEIESDVRRVLRELFKGIVITDRDGEGSTAIVLDVQALQVDAVSKETYFESRGEEISLEYERALTAELHP
ncbi:MAG: hypothetical protein JWO82_1837 [Akkermansiaceae bacterium]|nr:hypothetical protein [Akkermansiaceae bacterium]